MDPSTIPHRATDRELADDAEAAARHDGDLRRFAAAGSRGRDGAPVAYLFVAIACAGLAGVPVGYMLAVWWGMLP